MIRDGKKQLKQTSPQWAEQLGIIVKDFSNGYFDNIEYTTKLLTLEEFLNRMTHCDIKKPKEISRRKAASLRQDLIKKI